MDADGAFDDRGKLNNDYEFFERLRQLGQAAARRFLDAHFDDIGRRSTIDAAGGRSRADSGVDRRDAASVAAYRSRQPGLR